MVPNGVGTGKPPAKALPPLTVWQSLQLPIAARSRPRLTSAGSKDCAGGGSIPSIAGRQTTAKAAIAPPISAAMAALAMIPDFDIRPKLLLLWVALLAQLAGPRPNSSPAFDAGTGPLGRKARRFAAIQAGRRISTGLFYCFISGAGAAAANSRSNTARSALGKSHTAT